MTRPPTPAGWYPDPDGAGGQRYWDSSTWTEHRSPGPTSQPVEPPSAIEPPMPAEPRFNDNRTLLTRYLAVCGALLLVLILALAYGLFRDDNDDGLRSFTTTSPPETAGQPTTTAEEQAGTTTPGALPPLAGATVDGVLSFTVVDVETGTTVSSTEAPVEKTATGEYVVVRLSVVNDGDATAQFLGTLQKLHAGNTVYSIDGEATFYVGGGFVEIPPGAEALVGLAYDAPPGTVPEFIEAHADPLSPGAQIPLS
ncbi:uncharacterized membrane-bound protein [Mycolicibacterium flavescens]|uniref:DUF2510 domain-containing protein n=1 Tax=Mycobacterium neumannii TaxID=2048551 RepID=UPI000B93E9E9|nr:DUF2510 domain-containing protein [Mycobacterium neumannii]VEG45247.1 uncharacterized membrane-bound protein [Mycolicibacterium flavescens]